MKKLLSILMATLMIISLFAIVPTAVFATETDVAEVGATFVVTTPDGSYEYEVVEGADNPEAQVARIVKYTGTATELIVPSELGGYPVEVIGENTFRSCDGLVSATLSEGIISVERNAFILCFDLETINVPKTVRTFDSIPFCNLKNVFVDDENPYLMDDNGVLIDKVNSVLCLYPRNKKAESYTIPEGIVEIAQYAFHSAETKAVEIPDTVTKIGEEAFVSSELESIYIPASVIEMDTVELFWGCNYLTKIDVDSNNLVFSSVNGDLFSKDKTVLYCVPEGKNLTEYTVADGVTEIAGSAFGFNEISSIQLPEGLIKIGEQGFSNMDIESITIPDTVEHLGDAAFFTCKKLKSVEIPDSVTFMGKSIFWGCEALESVKLSNKTSSVNSLAFTGCTSLRNVDIPESVRNIRYMAFSDCAALESVTIPDSVTWIESKAFMGCNSLLSVTIPETTRSIGEKTFGYTVNEETGETVKIEEFTISGMLGSVAEDYAEKNGFMFVDNANGTVIFESNGVNVYAKADGELVVDEVWDEEVYNEIRKKLNSGLSISTVYDITLQKDGVEVQPDDQAKVIIPCNDSNAKVYRVEEDGSLTDMEAVYENGYLVFYTEHFSYYVVAVGDTSEMLLGDANGDEKVNVKDVTLIQKHTARIEQIAEKNMIAANVDGDKAVNVKDATAIQKYIAGMDTGFKIGEVI